MLLKYEKEKLRKEEIDQKGDLKKKMREEQRQEFQEYIENVFKVC